MPRYAVNLYDWLRFIIEKPLSSEALLLRPILSLKPVQCEERFDGVALETKPITEEHWDRTVFVLRADRHRNKFRLYQSKTGNSGWKQV